MRRKGGGGWKVALGVFCAAAVSAGAWAQWQIGEQVLSPPLRGLYYSMRLGTNAPPLPFLPCDVPVYFLGTRPGSTNLVFAFDDRDQSREGREGAQTSGNEPPPLPDDNGGGSGGGTNNPPPAYGYDYGTNLYLLIGLTNLTAGAATHREAWLVLTNTHYGKFYQLESRPRVVGAPWELGEIRQDTGSTNAVRFSNVPTIDPAQRFFRGVEGDTVASVTLDPDYNLAVEPATNGGSGQAGKFRVFLSPTVSHNVTLVYQMSGAASNGMDYSSLSGTVTVEANTSSATIDIHPLYDALPEFDETLSLTLVFTNGYLVEPSRASATMKIYDPRPEGMAVAIHDSGWTKFHGLSTTNWNYFVMPESVKEALRSDGTPYVVVSDLDIASGMLTNANGTPRYPILISLACECVRDDELAALTNYVNHGGFALVGSSSFTRDTDGNFRTTFPLSSEMGISCTPSTTSWTNNTYLAPENDHRLVNHIRKHGDWVIWRMPTHTEEISWGTCDDGSPEGHAYWGTHLIWPVTVSDAQVLAKGDDWALPYLTTKHYGSGEFIYDAALQPLIAHGGNGPGMYAYVIFRQAIEWAFEAAQRPIVKLGPWPFEYNAAFIVRHDLEHDVAAIAGVPTSAYYEQQHSVKGDYYFCTGAISNASNPATIIAGLQQAAASNVATIGPHNGGLANPRGSTCGLSDPTRYEYYHWGPDEALDLPGGAAYASNSMATSFWQIETWLAGFQDALPRVWVAPYFNATRERSYSIEEQLGIKITGDQKLTPFPHWTLSTQTDGKRYELLSEPVSDWFVEYEVAQALGVWQNHSSGPGFHTSETMSNAVDYYYQLGALINLYSHELTTAEDDTGQLVRDYISYCTDTNWHPRIWSANARDIYDWWVHRSAAQITANYGTNGSHSSVEVAIAGAEHSETAVEVYNPAAGSMTVFHVFTNGVLASNDRYRTTENVIKVKVGTSVTNVQVEYASSPKLPEPPEPRNDSYTAGDGVPLTVEAPGVLSNDLTTNWPALLIPTITSGPQHGSVEPSTNGGFSYTSTTNGTDCFTYELTDGTNHFGPATVTIFVTKTNAWFSDDFTRCISGIDPWQAQSGDWSLSGGVLQTTNTPNHYGNCYLATNWTSYSVEADLRFPAGGYGGGLGARLNPANGAHYAAWIFPAGGGGTNLLKLIKFSSWNAWGYGGTNYYPMAAADLPSVGTDWHRLKLVMNGSNLQVYYDGAGMISATDNEGSPYTSGGITLDTWTDLAPYTMSVSNLIVAP